MASNEKFSGVSSIGERLMLSQIENNIKSFLEWGFLHIGGFINVQQPNSNIYGNPLAKLKPTEDPNYTTGQVWQTMRKDWVWEDGVEYSKCLPTPSASVEPNEPCPSEFLFSTQPILISGIYINNIFYPLNTTGQYSYKVDYINSRIIFNNAINVSTNIEMEYSYRWVQVYNYDNAKWWQQLQYKTDDNLAHFNQINKGDFSVLSNNRVQLPAIIIESVARGLSKPFQLGDKSLVMKQEIMLHIVAETMNDRNSLIDIIRLQQDKFINMYDTNLIVRNNIQPFNLDGTLNNNRLQYDEILNNTSYRWLTARLTDIFASGVESFSPFLSEANVKLTVEIISGVNN
jgi:hypothetical protein